MARAPPSACGERRGRLSSFPGALVPEGLRARAPGRALTECFQSVRHFNAYDGMPVGECNRGDPNVLRLPDGRMAFACVGGVVIVDPRKSRVDEQPPHVIIASVEVDGVMHDDAEGVVILRRRQSNDGRARRIERAATEGLARTSKP